MVGTRASNRRAHANGNKGERLIGRRLHIHVDGEKRKQAPTVAQRIDGKFHRKLFEVKSCESNTREQGNTRTGRLNFSRRQHNALVRENGFYGFVVRKPNGKARTMVVRARDVPAPKGKARAFTVRYDHDAFKDAKHVQGNFRPESPHWWDKVRRILG